MKTTSKFFFTVTQICLMVLSFSSFAESSDSLSYDVFPLRLNLHYQYSLLRTYITYNKTVLSEYQVDSGRVDFVVRDSTLINNSTINWQVDRISVVMHRYDRYFPDSLHAKVYQDDTVRFTVTESLINNHFITFITIAENDIYNEPPFYHSLSPWSNITIDRFSTHDTVQQKSYNDTLRFFQSSGLINRRIHREYFGMYSFYDDHYIKQINFPTSINIQKTQNPAKLYLQQNYPNPFNPTTTISFNLPSKSFVSLKIFDALGREVSTLVNEELSAGNQTRQWNASNAASGVYFYQLKAGAFTETKKLLLLR